MIIEHNNFPDTYWYFTKDKAIYHQWLFNSIKNSNKTLWALTLPQPHHNWDRYIINSYKELKDNLPDKILLISRPENYSAKEWELAIQELIKIGYDKKNIMIIDTNFKTDVGVTHGSNHIFLNMYSVYDNIPYMDIFSRKHKFVSLSGIPRFNRVIFTKELLDRNLEKYGIITCGAVNDNELLTEASKKIYDFLDLGTQKNKFPVIYKETFSTIKHSGLIPKEFLNSIYNVVIESCFEDYMNLQLDPELFLLGTRESKFLTEKTVKTFCGFQIPVFVATAGFVNEIRDLGFDLFDDIVDHSYDRIEDPALRMKAVANELFRLVHTELPDNNIKNRLLKNKEAVKIVYLEMKNKLAHKILEWFNQ
jgi:hypothetical protein